MITLSKWVCHQPDCKNEAIFAGRSGLALLFVGWGTDLAETKTYCPQHHPLGEEQVKLQLEAAAMFLVFTSAINGPGGTTKIIEFMRLSGINIPDNIIDLIREQGIEVSDT